MHSQYLAQFSSYRSDSTCSEKPFSLCFERYMVRRISCYFRRSVFAHHTYSDLPLCDQHISLSSHRIVPIRPVLKSYFHSVSNDIRYVVFRATFGDRLSSPVRIDNSEIEPNRAKYSGPWRLDCGRSRSKWRIKS